MKAQTEKIEAAVTVTGYALEAISFWVDDNEIVIAADSPLTIDPKKGIAHVAGYHFEIYPNQYVIAS